MGYLVVGVGLRVIGKLSHLLPSAPYYLWECTSVVLYRIPSYAAGRFGYFDGAGYLVLANDDGTLYYI